MNFTLADLAGTGAALAIFPLFCFAPGYVAAWALDLFGFRRRTAGFRAALSLPLSLALCPVLTYLAGSCFTMNAAWLLWAVCAVAFGFLLPGLVRLLPPWRNVDRATRWLLLLAGVWMLGGLLLLVDLQLGRRLYFPALALDYSVRSAFVSAIARDGLPAHNPFFFPGHAVLLRYHYFWLIPCSFVNMLGAGLVTARHAIAAGALWTGAAMAGTIALFLRLFESRTLNVRSRLLRGVLLAGVSGLDVIPLAALYLAFGTVMLNSEGWNEEVGGFLHTLLWEPHHAGALLAGLTGWLLLWQSARETGWRGRAVHALVAGVALATTIGASIYVALVFAAFLALWTLYVCVRRWWLEAAALAVAGTATVLVALPYLLSLRGPAPGGAPLAWQVRDFRLAHMLLTGMGMDTGFRVAAVNAALLPLNYLLEFGVFALVAVVKLHEFRARRWRLERHETAAALLACVSLAICTFVCSGVISNNDLGWRGLLPLQFVLLLWAIDLLPAIGRGGTRKAAVAMLALGAATNVYEAGSLRFFTLLLDIRGASTVPNWVAPGHPAGEWTFAAREAYEWVDAHLPSRALVQFNPRVQLQDTGAMLYLGRQSAVGGPHCLTAFGGDPAQCPAVEKQAVALFAVGATEATYTSTCEGLKLGALVSRRSDPVWTGHSSWVWTQLPRFSNHYYSVFDCGVDSTVKR